MTKTPSSSTASKSRIALLAAIVAALVFPVLAPYVGIEFYIGFASRIMIFIMAVSSLNLLVGYAGLVSFGHAAFFGMGAYAIAMVTVWGGTVFPAWIKTVWFAWPFAMACGALLALLIGSVALRTKQVYFIMITLAFSQMAYYLAIGMNTFGSDNGMSLKGRSPVGLANLSLASDHVFYYTVLGLLVLVLLGLRALIRSRFGVVIRAIAMNESRMSAIGYPVFRYRLVCFVIAGAIAGLAGALLANQNSYVSPHMLDWTKSGLLLVMLILGGAGYLSGAIYGAATLLILEETLSPHTAYWQTVVGVCIIVVVLLGKHGIAGLIHGVPKPGEQT